ncbi:MAG TPA: 3'-5' exonuclease [Candidatus Ozemobacteraceae bacterium]|nr:3'-5' exonuclease [Candidatus Ozemobacteraceae bacterium]
MSASLERQLAGLNPRQIEAVEITEGPLLVVAGAGSGKTRMLTMRIASLIERKGVDPSAILAVTFTNKAAKEMRERVQALLPGRGEAVTLTTFHTFCSQLLRRWHEAAGFPEGFTIYDEDDSEKLMKLVLAALELDPKKYTPRAMLSLISQAKNELEGPEEFKPPHFESERITTVYRRYQEALTKNQAVDFDDLIFCVWKMLNARPDLLERLQQRYRYFLVDEYQDTNTAQYKLIALLSSASRNLCVVGDEDQSIYSWRGATIRNIREFEKDFAGARVVYLEQNYRSTQGILDAASAVIANNAGTHKKQLWTTNGAGELPRFIHTSDDREEAERIVSEIRRLEREGIPYGQMAVLFRMNSLSRTIEQALSAQMIPYDVTGGLKFFERREVKDILAYLRFLGNRNDSISLRRIINTPRRGIGDATVAKLAATGDLWGETLVQAAASPRGKLAAFVKLMEELVETAANAPVSVLAKTILERTQYIEWLYETEEEDEAKDRESNVESLLADIRFQEEENRQLTLREYLEKVALHAAVDDVDEAAERVHLMTLHNAKGLEFPVVFLMAMEEGVFPHHSSKDLPHQLEEERRLAYVGMTRAMRRLYLTAARRRMMFGGWLSNPVSRFIGEVPAGMLEGRPGGGASAGFAGSGTGWRPSSGSSAPAYSFARTQPPAEPSRDIRAQTPAKPLPSYGFRKIATPAAGSSPSGSGVTPENSEPGTMLNLQAGTHVVHQIFGHGHVVSTDGSGLGDFRLTIDFATAGRKTLLLQYAALRVIKK